jgi:hypothetical protein
MVHVETNMPLYCASISNQNPYTANKYVFSREKNFNFTNDSNITGTNLNFHILYSVFTFITYKTHKDLYLISVLSPKPMILEFRIS